MWLKHYNLSEKEQAFVNMPCEVFYNYIKDKYRELIAVEDNQPINLFGFEVNTGWHHVINQMFEEVSAISDPSSYEVRFTQIKEKFGGPRFYYDIYLRNEEKENEPEKKAIENLIAHHESYCDTIDDLTGKNLKESKLTLTGWMHAHSLSSYVSLIESSDRTQEEKEKMIAFAKKGMTRSNLLKEVRDSVYKLKIEDLNKVKALINELIA